MQSSSKVNTNGNCPKVKPGHEVNMLTWAQFYIGLGWPVFPVHVPIFDADGACVGCTCEDWRRQQPKYGPSFKCDQPGKCPAVNWKDKATTDPEQIKKWWGYQWTAGKVKFRPNIGISCGPAGLLVMDEDAYKAEYGDLGDLLSPDEQNTLTQLSGSHKGQHLFYAMPAGKDYGNATGNLPKGIDVRGSGGYIVAAPSVHRSGNRYEWVDELAPGQVELQPVPMALQGILDEANNKAAKTVVFSDATTKKPNLSKWNISEEIHEMINTPAATGKRSENDQSVCLSLVYAGATDNDILSVFEHYPIGTEGKFAERGRDYLALAIAKARSFAKENPRETPASDLLVESVRSLGYTFKLNRLEDLIEVNGKRLDDITMSKIYLAMRNSFSKTPKTYVDDCINVLADENAYHPIRDYLNGLQWDGKNHLGNFLGYLTGDGRTVEYSNGKSPLYAALFTRWLLGCVARGLDGDKPAAFKHQTPMLVLIGPQGIGKSSIIRWLCTGVGLDYHRESMLDPHHPDHIRSAVTKWIWEVSELGASLRRGDRDALKGFITQEWHTYRKPWGKANITKPLLSNFVGTINPEVGFLDDPTGHRRFLPIDIKAINHGYKDAVDVNQLWAQLVHKYKNGDSPELAEVELAALQETYQEHAVENPLQTYLQMYFDIRPGDISKRTFTTDIIDRLRAFGVSLHTDNRVAGALINAALAPLGVERKLLKMGDVSGRGWVGVAPNTKRTPTQFR